MLSVQNNLLAMNADNFFKINSRENKRSTEKLSSGYRINRAADDAAGLAISEKMRRQIRGLMQGTSNAQDGISFVQVADGAMDEVHGMLQRMNELALKSLNGTCSDSDRAALNAEFEQLRAEIDRISGETEYNEQPVFEEHEDSYYQIVGCRRWNDNQPHIVPALNNEMNIHLPAYYNPSDYTLTVPAGNYTTRELMDEIDSALERLKPSNPGFVFEYTDTGICKLNFERSDGMPTEIASVDGSLSYLLFDSFKGSSSSSLLGTTVFGVEFPFSVVEGQNNVLEFYVESANGSNFISIDIPAGEYFRSEMIKKINELLSKHPEAAGITAKEYSDANIQITGGDSVSIIGLKGNMFKLDPESIKYSSVFYDNVQYGTSSGGIAASVIGKAYYNASVTEKIHLSATNQNNVLCFKVNGAANYTKISFANKDDGYTLAEIRDEINKQLKEKGLEDVVKASTTSTWLSVPSSSTGTSSYSMQYLTFSSTLKGSNSSLEFDTTDPVAVNTYNALFRDTDYIPYKVSGRKAQLAGRADLKVTFTLPADASLTFKINDQSYTISGIGGDYANGQEIVDDLNAYMQTNPAFAAVKDKITFQFDPNSGYISINAQTDDVQKIDFDADKRNDTYKKLLVGTATYTNYISSGWSYGTVTQKEGTTEKEAAPATAHYAIPADRQNSKITITSDTNKISFSSSDGQKVVTLPTGTYSMTDIVSQINAQLKPSGNSCFNSITCSYENDRLNLTAMPKKGNAVGDYSISFDYSSSAWKAILGTYTADVNPSRTLASKYIMGNRIAIPDTTKLDNRNNELTLNIGQDSATINIATGTYNKEALKNAVQDAINTNNTLKDKVTVYYAANGMLEFASSNGAITASGSFYDLITQKAQEETIQKGSYPDYSFQDAFIIGRKDLSTEPVDIVSGANDMFTFDFTHKDSKSVENKKEINVKIPEGTYNGNEIAKALQGELQKKFDEEGLTDFYIEVSIGGEKTEVVGANDDTALQIKVKRKTGKEPEEGQYVIDGVRGSAAGFLFYKTTINPKATYITGTKNLSNGITFKPGKNVFTLSVDSVPYKYTLPVNTNYTAEEFANLLNDRFENGDDNGTLAPLTASIENGNLKIAHKALGSHSITNIGGGARSVLFLEENGRNSRDPIYLLVGSETKDLFEIPRTRISSCSLSINSVIISRPKYAEKAVNRIKEAITMVSTRRSTYGSAQNRLEHTIHNNNNVTENTQASESVIRDTDIASESMEFAKSKFLMQSSQTVLAQANQQANLVLNLLQS